MKAMISLRASLKPLGWIQYFLSSKLSKTSRKKPYGAPNHKGNYTSFLQSIPTRKRATLLFIIIFYEETSMKSWSIITWAAKNKGFFSPRASKDRKCGMWYHWSSFSILQMRLEMWCGWWGSPGYPKKMANIFKTFMWDMSVYFIHPIQELNFIFNTVCTDILCG